MGGEACDRFEMKEWRYQNRLAVVAAYGQLRAELLLGVEDSQQVGKNNESSLERVLSSRRGYSDQVVTVESLDCRGESSGSQHLTVQRTSVVFLPVTSQLPMAEDESSIELCERSWARAPAV